MGRFVVGAERDQTTLFPPCLEDWIAEDNPVRVVDAFVDALELGALGLRGSMRHARVDRLPSGRSPEASTSTAISTGSRRADGWSARRAAMSRSCG